MRNTLILLVATVFLACTGNAFAQQQRQPPAPEVRALGQMLQEAQQREAETKVSIYQMNDQLIAEKKRADEAEAKLKLAESAAKPVEPAKK